VTSIVGLLIHTWLVFPSHRFSVVLLQWATELHIVDAEMFKVS